MPVASASYGEDDGGEFLISLPEREREIEGGREGREEKKIFFFISFALLLVRIPHLIPLPPSS